MKFGLGCILVGFVRFFWDSSFAQVFLKLGQPGAQGSAEETVVTDFDESMWQDVLEKAVQETLHREGASFELSGIRSAILESDL